MWPVFAGRTRGGDGHGALLMLVAASGVAAFVAVQFLLIDAAGDHALPQRFRDDTGPSPEGSVVLFVPAAALLMGAALAYLSPKRTGG